MKVVENKWVVYRDKHDMSLAVCVQFDWEAWLRQAKTNKYSDLIERYEVLAEGLTEEQARQMKRLADEE